MATWERDRSVSQSGSMLFLMAWSPLFWVVLLAEARFTYPDEFTFGLVGLGAVMTGYPLFLLSESRPFVQQHARLGMGALAVLCAMALLGLPVWSIGAGGMAVWLASSRLIHGALSVPRWRTSEPFDASNLGSEWHRQEGLSKRFFREVLGTRGLLSMGEDGPYLDVIGSGNSDLTPVDFGLDEDEEG